MESIWVLILFVMFVNVQAQCNSAPCANGATCNDTNVGFTCTCPQEMLGHPNLVCSYDPCPGYWSGTNCSDLCISNGFEFFSSSDYITGSMPNFDELSSSLTLCSWLTISSNGTILSISAEHGSTIVVPPIITFTLINGMLSFNVQTINPVLTATSPISITSAFPNLYCVVLQIGSSNGNVTFYENAIQINFVEFPVISTFESFGTAVFVIGSSAQSIYNFQMFNTPLGLMDVSYGYQYNIWPTSILQLYFTNGALTDTSPSNVQFVAHGCPAWIGACNGPCLNGGTLQSNLSCLCASGYVGNHCELALPCTTSNLCSNNGTCVNVGGSVSQYCPGNIVCDCVSSPYTEDKFCNEIPCGTLFMLSCDNQEPSNLNMIGLDNSLHLIGSMNLANYGCNGLDLNLLNEMIYTESYDINANPSLFTVNPTTAHNIDNGMVGNVECQGSVTGFLDIKFLPGTNILYATSANGCLQVIDITNGTVLNSTLLSVLAGAIVFSPDGSTLYSAVNSGTSGYFVTLNITSGVNDDLFGGTPWIIIDDLVQCPHNGAQPPFSVISNAENSITVFSAQFNGIYYALFICSYTKTVTNLVPPSVTNYQLGFVAPVSKDSLEKIHNCMLGEFYDQYSYFGWCG